MALTERERRAWHEREARRQRLGQLRRDGFTVEQAEAIVREQEHDRWLDAMEADEHRKLPARIG